MLSKAKFSVEDEVRRFIQRADKCTRNIHHLENPSTHVNDKYLAHSPSHVNDKYLAHSPFIVDAIRVKDI
jgi:protein involved in ribonucleotide reduction